MKRSAAISECGRYRWWLRRDWSGLYDPVRVVTFIMLNPSTADATVDDPTIRRCIGFADSWGFTAISVRNLFAWRATDPTELNFVEDAIGEYGDAEIMAARESHAIIAAWGASVPMGRDVRVMEMLRGVPLWCLGRTKDGHPRHPLYVKGDTVPQPFRDCVETWDELRRRVEGGA